MQVEVYQKIEQHLVNGPVPEWLSSVRYQAGYGYLTYTAKVPTRGSVEAAGYDVRAFLPSGEMSISPLQTVMVPTGLFVAIEPHGVILVCSRSGMATKGVMVANGPGIIDSDYRGEIKIILSYITKLDAPPYVIRHDDRIAQLLFLRAGEVSADVKFIPVQNPCLLRLTDRGDGGFGSTGR